MSLIKVFLMAMLGVLLFGCNASQPREFEKKETNNEIETAISNLKNDLGPIDLGVMHPVRSKNINFLISQGSESEPYLLKALLESKNSIVIGNTAFCLQEMECKRGLDVATKLLKKIKATEMTFEDRFAALCLSGYIREFSAQSKESSKSTSSELDDKSDR